MNKSFQKELNFYETTLADLNSLTETLNTIASDHEVLPEIHKRIKDANLQIQKLQKLEVLPLLETYFSMATYLKLLSNQIIQLYDIIDHNFVHRSFNAYLSQTTLNDFIKLEGTKYAHFLKYYKTTTFLDTLIEASLELATQLLKDSSPKTIYEEIRIFFHKDYNSIELYVPITQFLIKSALLETTKDEAFYILYQINDDKNLVLFLGEKHKSYAYKTYGLIANSGVLTLEELSSRYEVKSTKLESFIKKMTQEVDIIIFNRITYNPIGYDVSKLLHSKVKDNTGINIEILERDKILIFFPKENKWDLSFDIYESKKKENQKAVIIEMITNNDQFKIMANYYSFDNNQPLYVSKHAIEFIYDEYNSKKSYSRINDYNHLIITNAMSNLFLPYQPDIDKIEESSSNIDPKYLRNEIYLEIIDFYTKNKKNITNYVALKNIFTNDRYQEIFTDIITREFVKILQSYAGYETEQLDLSEVIYAFLYNIQYLSKFFMKELYDKFSAGYKRIDLENKEKIDEAFQNIINTVLQKYINNSSNIYKFIVKKIAMLKLSLTD